MKELRGGLAGVANRNQIHMAARQKAAVGVRVFVHADGQNGQIRLVMMQIQQRRQFHNTRFAPGGPEIEQHHAAPVIGEMDARGAIGHSEIGSGLPGLGRMGAAIASRQRCQR